MTLEQTIAAFMAAYTNELPAHKEISRELAKLIEATVKPFNPLAGTGVLGAYRNGTRVAKVDGYRFPGVIVSSYLTQKKELRYVVECDVPEVDGIQHIFAPKQLTIETPDQIKARYFQNYKRLEESGFLADMAAKHGGKMTDMTNQTALSREMLSRHGKSLMIKHREELVSQDYDATQPAFADDKSNFVEGKLTGAELLAHDAKNPVPNDRSDTWRKQQTSPADAYERGDRAAWPDDSDV